MRSKTWVKSYHGRPFNSRWHGTQSAGTCTCIMRNSKVKPYFHHMSPAAISSSVPGSTRPFASLGKTGTQSKQARRSLPTSSRPVVSLDGFAAQAKQVRICLCRPPMWGVCAALSYALPQSGAICAHHARTHTSSLFCLGQRQTGGKAVHSRPATYQRPRI